MSETNERMNEQTHELKEVLDIKSEMVFKKRLVQA